MTVINDIVEPRDPRHLRDMVDQGWPRARRLNASSRALAFFAISTKGRADNYMSFRGRSRRIWSQNTPLCLHDPRCHSVLAESSAGRTAGINTPSFDGKRHAAF